MDLLDAHKTAMQRLWIGFKRSIHHPADNYTLIQQLDEKLNYYHAIILAVKTDTREPVGFATLNRLDNQTLEYSSAYVKHECRQQGILDGMTEEIMRIADVEKRTGAEYIVADLISDQLPVRFLTDRGFEIEEGPSELPDAIPLRRRL